VARIEESHKGHDIVIEEPEGGGDRRALEVEAQQEPLISIDGQPIKVFQHPDGTYSSESIYYDKYDSLLELARASIDTFLPEG
jgi:hypothetical protein